jgi:hypothetical protein
MLRLFRWLATDPGVATLDYVGWILCGTGTIALLLGPTLTARVAQFLDGIRAHLTSSRIVQLSRWVAVGAMGRVASGVFGLTMVVYVAFDVEEIFRALYLAYRGVPADGHLLAEFLLFISREHFVARAKPLPVAGMEWLIAAAVPTLMPPVFCLGVIEKLRAARDPRIGTKGEGEWIRKVVALWREALWRHQAKVNPLRQLYRAVVGTTFLFAHGVGGLVGLAIRFFLTMVSYAAQAPLLALATLANRNILKIIITALGVLLRTLAFLIKLAR